MPRDNPWRVPGYYKRLKMLVEELGLPTTPAHVDCTFYGDDGSGGTESIMFVQKNVTVALFLFPLAFASSFLVFGSGLIGSECID
jgi:hypothetical protein